jgi:hypothetical protein
MLEVSDVLLLVVDVQEKLERVMFEREALLLNLKKLIRGIQVLGIPILVTEQYPKGLGPTVPELASLFDDFRPISKQSFSCLGNEEFLSALGSYSRKQVLIAGIEGHICVYQTTKDLLRKGYKVSAVIDAISSRTEFNRRFSFDLMKDAGASLTSVETILFELLKVGEGDKFKKISQIVK